MNILKKILFVLGAIIALVLISTFFMPSERHLERSITINASPETVFSVVNDLSQFNDWSAWSKLDPNTKYEHEGPKAGVGAKQSWASEDPNVGVGSQWIVESVPNELVKMDMKFDGQDGTPQAALVLSEDGEGTAVTYTFDAVMEGVSNKLFGSLLEYLLGPAYEDGLANLKQLVEAMPAQEVDSMEEVLETDEEDGLNIDEE